MTDVDAVEDFLEHHGVKGMKWGVRRGTTFVKSGIANGNYGGKGNIRVGQYGVGDHTKSRLKGTGLNLLGEVASAYISPLASHWSGVKPIVDRELSAINKKYEGMASKPKLKSRYDAEVQKMIEHTFKNTTVKGLGLPSASARIANKRMGDLKNAKYEFYTNGKSAFLKVTTDRKSENLRVGKFKHSDNTDIVSFDIPVVLTRDSEDFVVDVSIPALENVEHADAVADFLEHHGVKGMKWGQHRFGRAQAGAHGGDKPPWHSAPPKKAPVISSRPVKKGFFGKTKTPAMISEEARQLHEIRMKVKKHGVHSLTNKELEAVNKRLELQQKYQKAHPKKQNPIVNLVLDTVLSDHGSTKIKSLMEDKGAGKNLMNMVEAAITINKVARTKK